MNKLNPIWVLFSSSQDSMIEWVSNGQYIHIKSPSARIRYLKNRQDYINEYSYFNGLSEEDYEREVFRYIQGELEQDDHCQCNSSCKKCSLMRAEHGVYI